MWDMNLQERSNLPTVTLIVTGRTRANERLQRRGTLWPCPLLHVRLLSVFDLWICHFIPGFSFLTRFVKLGKKSIFINLLVVSSLDEGKIWAKRHSLSFWNQNHQFMETLNSNTNHPIYCKVFTPKWSLRHPEHPLMSSSHTPLIGCRTLGSGFRMHEIQADTTEVGHFGSDEIA